MRFRFINILVILAVLILYSTASGQMSVDPVGFAVAIEQEDTLETEMILHNAGDEAVVYNVRIRNVNREDERRYGPRRDDPGETLLEIQLEYNYIVGLAWDAENEIMYASHTADARIAGYLWNGEEILDIPLDFAAQNIPANSLVGLAFFDNVFYTFYWGQSVIYRYDIEGNQLESINTQWNDELTYGLGLAVDPENAHLYMSAFHNAGAHSDIKVYDINDDYAQVGYIDGIENMGENRNPDVRNRLCWIPEHEDGHLWIYQRDPDGNGGAGPYWPPYHAWQVNVIPGEEGEWDYEVATHFEVESDAWSNGIGHDGENLWIGTRDDNTVRIVDDGLSEAKWLTIEPRSGEVAAGEDASLDVVIIPVELEEGVYEQLIRISIDDPAQPVIEMSAVMALNAPTANVTGTVTDAATGEPIEDVKGELDYYIITRTTDEEGNYAFENLPLGEYVFTFSHPDYMPNIVELNIDEAGEVVEDVELLHGEFNLNREEIVSSVEPDNDVHEAFEVSNDGNAPVTYRSERQLLGEFEVEPWEARDVFSIGQNVEDDGIMGVVFLDDHFYVSGENDDEPSIYIFDREGELVETIPQVGENDASMRDLAWDGELIWGTVQSFIYGFTPEGELVTTLEGPFRPLNCITWDPDRELLWIATTTRDIIGIDLEGNVVSELERNDLRMYGLAYWSVDPDGHPLYVFSKERDTNRQTVHKFDPEEGDTMFVTYLEPEAGGSPVGAFITNEFDIYSWVFMDISSASRNAGGDRIDIWQLDVRRDWFMLDPTEGVIEFDESQEFDLHLNAQGLPAAIFEGEVVFFHNGFGSETRLPVTLNVVEGRVPTNRTLQLDLGWNMVSVNLQPDEEDVTVLTRPLVDEDLLLMMKDGAGHFYNPEFGFNNIPGWFVDQGYMMKMEDDAELRLEGVSVLAGDPIELSEGWQIVSYYPRVAVDAIIALSRIREQLLIAKDGWGNFYIPEWEFSNIGDMREGRGYQLKMEEDTELVYSLQEELDAAIGWRHSPADHRPEHLPVHPVTGVNMSLLVTTEMDWRGDVGVYVSERLVGSARIHNGACGVAVWGDDPTTEETDGALAGEPLTIKLWDTNVEIPVKSEYLAGDGIYETDGFAVLSLESEVAIPTACGFEAVYPNPFNSSVCIAFAMDVRSRVSLKVYDLAGREATTLTQEILPVGKHEVVWDGGSLPSGLYILRLETNLARQSMKIALVR